MVCCNNICIEDQSMESPSCYCEAEEEEQDNYQYTSQCKWNKQSQVIVTALLALRAAQDKTKSFFALPTQQTRTVGIALLVRIDQVNVPALLGAVVKWTVTVMDKPFLGFIVI